MSAQNRLFNQTNTTNFVVDIPDHGLTKAFTLNAQSAAIPGIRIPISELPSGTQGLGRAQLPGSTFEFDPLMVRFLVDENLESWLSMYKWMLSINNYITSENSNWTRRNDYFITVHILDNAKKNIVMSVHYYGAWCADLSEIEYNYTEDSDPAMICTAIIPYKYLLIEKNGVIIEKRENPELPKGPGMHPSLRNK
ncbi:tail completion and sheath stabilizer protein [Pseudomonas phage PspYZU05]|uniref:Tail completion and sheath stabilizer protein n=1 Tax=Pseudomonas phage PspYZU05 TaxID=1983556 RepID=A0A2U7NBT5_9CAUD|nr:tail completion and sheath stabilizer protein [Pseudomonas phage PspYZU05]ASD52059.1 tail completion and sheath stabilizer protein [Pseudomonas phage PspYZU05]